MILDLRTMYVVGAMTCIVLGGVQLLAFATGRFEKWPAWWGVSNILLGLGMLGTALRDVVPSLVSIVLANAVTLAGYLLLLAGVRVFAGKDPALGTGLAVVSVTSALMLLAWPDPADYQERVAVASLLFAVCDFAIIREGVGLALRGGLASAWILVGLFAATGLIFAGRAALATTGHLGGPELFSPMPAAHQWLAVTGTVFLNLRGIILLLLAAERNRNLLLAQAQHDPLTGAMNRSGLERSVERLARPGVPTPGALLLIDIDHFKALNDTHGHDAGDKVLRLFTGVARAELRHGDVLARQGGDEFVVLVPGAGLAEAIGIAERIRRAFDDTLAAWTELRVRPTLSIGVTAGDLAPGQLDAALKTADDALYRSKRQGRNRVHALARDVEAAH